jgi:hypothetical protein
MQKELNDLVCIIYMSNNYNKSIPVWCVGNKTKELKLFNGVYVSYQNKNVSYQNTDLSVKDTKMHKSLLELLKICK